MPRIFLSHSSNDNSEATALRQWLIDQRPELVDEIFLDIAEDAGLAPGQRWKDALRQANQRCEAVICLVSHSWGSSPECIAYKCDIITYLVQHTLKSDAEGID